MAQDDHSNLANSTEVTIDQLRFEGKHEKALELLFEKLRLENLEHNCFDATEVWIDHVAGRFIDQERWKLSLNCAGFLLWDYVRFALNRSAANLDRICENLEAQESALSKSAEFIFERERLPEVAIKGARALLAATFSIAKCAIRLKLALGSNEAGASLTDSVHSLERAIANYCVFWHSEDSWSSSGDHEVVFQLSPQETARRAIDRLIESYTAPDAPSLAIPIGMAERGLRWLFALDEELSSNESSVPILFVSNVDGAPVGTSGKVCLQFFDGVTKRTVFPDPVYLGILPLDLVWRKAFDDAVTSAMRVLEDGVDCGTKSFRWHIRFLTEMEALQLSQHLTPGAAPDRLRRPLLLEGDSASAGFACALVSAAHGKLLHHRIVVTAAIDEAGKLTAIGNELTKLDTKLWKHFLEGQVDYVILAANKRDSVSGWVREQARSIRYTLLREVGRLDQAVAFFLHTQQAYEEYTRSELRASRNRLGLITPIRIDSQEIDNIIETLHVPLSVAPTGTYNSSENLDFDQALLDWAKSDSQMLIIKGPPGAGKTWLSIRTSQLLSRFFHGTGKSDVFPIWLTADQLFSQTGSTLNVVKEALSNRLRFYGDSLGDRSAQTAVLVDRVESAARSRNIVYIVDGFDEAKNAMAEISIRQALSFGRMVLFSRPTSHEIPSISQSTTAFALQPLSHVHEELFIDRWFDSQAEAGLFRAELQYSVDTAKLMGTPLFAAILCWLWEDRERLKDLRRWAGLSRDSGLPQKPSDLVKLFLTAYLTKSFRSEAESLDPNSVWISVLPPLARQAANDFTGERWNVGPSDLVSRLAQNQHGRGLFVYDESNDQYYIIHQLFAEWLTASHIHSLATGAGQSYWNSLLSSGEAESRVWNGKWATMLSLFVQMADATESAPLVEYIYQKTLGSATKIEDVAIGGLETVCEVLGGTRYDNPDFCLKVVQKLIEFGPPKYPHEFSMSVYAITAVCNGCEDRTRSAAELIVKELLNTDDENRRKGLLAIFQPSRSALSDQSKLELLNGLCSDYLANATMHRERYVPIIQAVTRYGFESSDISFYACDRLLHLFDSQVETEMRVASAEIILAASSSLADSVSESKNQFFKCVISRYFDSSEKEVRLSLLKLLLDLAGSRVEIVREEFQKLESSFYQDTDKEIRSSVENVLENLATSLLADDVDFCMLRANELKLSALVCTERSYLTPEYLCILWRRADPTIASSELFKILRFAIGAVETRQFEELMDYAEELRGTLTRDVLQGVLDIFSRATVEDPKLWRHAVGERRMRCFGFFDGFLSQRKIGEALEPFLKLVFGKQPSSDDWLARFWALQDWHFITESDSEAEEALLQLSSVCQLISKESLIEACTGCFALAIMSEEQFESFAEQRKKESEVFAKISNERYSELRQRCRDQAIQYLARLDSARCEKLYLYATDGLLSRDENERWSVYPLLVSSLKHTQTPEMNGYVRFWLDYLSNQTEKALNWPDSLYLDDLLGNVSKLANEDRKELFLEGIQLMSSRRELNCYALRKMISTIADSNISPPLLDHFRAAIEFAASLSDITEQDRVFRVASELAEKIGEHEFHACLEFFESLCNGLDNPPPNCARIGKLLLDGIAKLAANPSERLFLKALQLYCDQSQIFRNIGSDGPKLLETNAPAVTSGNAVSSFRILVEFYCHQLLTVEDFLESSSRSKISRTLRIISKKINQIEAERLFEECLARMKALPRLSQDDRFRNAISELGKQLGHEYARTLLCSTEQFEFDTLHAIAKSHQLVRFPDGTVLGTSTNPLAWSDPSRKSG